MSNRVVYLPFLMVKCLESFYYVARPVSTGEFRWKFVAAEVTSNNWLEKCCYLSSKKIVPANLFFGFDANVHCFAHSNKGLWLGCSL